MNLKRVAGWAALFGLLLAYILAFERTSPLREEVPAERLLNVSMQQIREVSIVSGSHKLRLVRKGGNWQTDASGQQIMIPQQHIESLVRDLLETIRIDVVAEGSAHLDQFGLASPWAHISIALEEMPYPVVVRLGAISPSQVSMYAQVEREPRVVLIGTYLRFAITTFLHNVNRAKKNLP